MKELVYNGQVVGVFSSSEKATEYAHIMGYEAFSIMPLGTFVALDDFMEYPKVQKRIKEQKS